MAKRDGVLHHQKISAAPDIAAAGLVALPKRPFASLAHRLAGMIEWGCCIEDPADDLGKAVILERHQLLAHQIPIMYAVLLVNVATLAAIAASSTPGFMSLGVPTALSVIVTQRLIYFARSVSDIADVSVQAAQQKRMVLRSVVLSTGYSLWVVSMLRSGNIAQDGIAAMLAYVSALGCAFCMATLPRSAQAAVIIAPAPVALVMLTSHNLLLVGLGINLMLVSLLALRLLRRHHLSFVEGVRSKLLLAQEGERARAAEGAAARLARTDTLTGLANRRGLLEALEQLTAPSKRAPELAVALLDLNDFKPVNDTYGHPVGDELLEAVARRLEQVAPACVLACRLGGDEFALILSGVHDQRTGVRAARSICSALAMPYALPNGPTVSISACCGVSLIEPGDDTRRLLSRVDHMLYKLKNRRHERRKARTS
jgi:diguanylate cyclase (GGDEF)-like protein